MKKADYIFCGDIHITEDGKVPVCRTDVAEFDKAKWDKIAFIKKLAKKHDCAVLTSGDFFDFWKTSPELITRTIKALRGGQKWWTIYGDHCLPQHSWDQRHKSGLTTLAEAGAIHIMNGGHGKDKNSNKLKDPKPSKEVKGRKLFAWHVLTWKKDLPYPNCTTSNAKKLLKKYPQFDCIITGDNHKPFVEKYKGRILVNVGSMMRTRADQVKYKPAVWLYYADTNSVEKVYLHIHKNVISREHIESKAAKESRIDSFIERINVEIAEGLSLDANFAKVYKENSIKKKIRNIITKALGNADTSK